MKVRSSNKPTPLAVVVADIHLSATAPSARSDEPDWFEAMRRPLSQLEKLANSLNVPPICGGDVFDKWNPTPPLVNFALEHLPRMWSVAGQHDLPYHDFSRIGESAFGVLLKAGKLQLLTDEPTSFRGFVARGYSWEQGIKPVRWRKEDEPLNVAVVHSYIWRKGCAYTGAPESARAHAYQERLQGHDVAVFGDNHKPFALSLLSEYKGRTKSTTIWNNGSFLRRHTDERTHMPRVGILLNTGLVDLHLLDCSQDVFSEAVQALVEGGASMQEFMKELGTLAADSLDFRKAVKGYFDTYEISKGTRRLLLRAMNQ